MLTLSGVLMFLAVLVTLGGFLFDAVSDFDYFDRIFAPVFITSLALVAGGALIGALHFVA